ncbi:MAG: NAD(P)-binding protein, partial [Spirochaetia bacterium]|nr:NAD(P)-binding protein [Spirochaetia bacterium]
MGYKTRTRDLVSFREEVSCMTGCPINTDCGMYVQQIAKGDFEAGYLTARSPNPFASSCGRVCAAPCEDNCRRGRVDEPISIRSLKKFLTEQYGPESSRPETQKRLINGEQPASHFHSMHASALKQTAPQDTGGKKVAVIGAGPAGLSCAHDLAILGYSVTVFDNFDKGGGMMRYGIPSYRLPDQVIDSEIETIRSMGVTINQNQAVKSIDELKSQGFNAIFIGTGVTLGRKIPIEGADLPGTLTA